ncbi:MAG TPA: leucine--tRNA ligase [Actinomycetota bacterium]|nr:leucine--tRNA ligase [Actinomycetota bacterium]
MATQETQIERYDPAAIEPRWAESWVADRIFEADENSSKPKFYALDMFPYPSGDLHMGHLEAFTGGDVIARYKWMRGYNVLHPIGWDAFGLPAENAAIKRGIHPKEWTYANIDQQARSFVRLGMSFDWSRRFNTCDPDFYVWTQWLFLKFHDAGLVYRKSVAVNWCPNDRTVLANEQVVNGRCERCDTPVTKRAFASWFFRESDYAQKLLDSIDNDLEGWTDHIKTIQRNWIGRSEGADVTFKIEGRDEELVIFTTRPDTLWGATYMVLAPEHPLARELARTRGREKEFDAYIEAVKGRSEIERLAQGKRKLGFDLAATATNPVNGESIPIWVGDYVLMEYGTGAIMAVPGHDLRDFEFAKQEGLPIRFVIKPPDAELDPNADEPYVGEGAMVNSGPFDGTKTPDGIPKVVAWLEEHGHGTGRVRYRLRDWNVSRQRYWGAPIPMILCPECGEVPVPENELPVLLPDLDDYTPTEDGLSPLAKNTDWINAACPSCGKPARRETDTFDTFVDSSWYFFRYAGPADDAPFDRDRVAYWMPADHYTGGITHATGHLIYSRFFTKVLHDLGMVPFDEPYPNLTNQGMVIMEGAAMSKSRGNLVTPSAIVDEFGADTARVTMLFAGPFEADVDWADVSPQGVFRWLSRIWRAVLDRADRIRAGGSPSEDSPLRRATHHAIEGVTHDLDRHRFNVAISKLMVLTNGITDAEDAADADIAEAVTALLQMLAPMAPFIAEELWHRLGHEETIHMTAWPVPDATLLVEESLTMVVQVNGKVRDRIDIPAGTGEEEMQRIAMESERVRSHLEGKTVVKVIVVPPKLVNIVVR